MERMGQHITQTEMATALGISKAYLCDIEHGRREIRIDGGIGPKILEYLGMMPKPAQMPIRRPNEARSFA